LTFVPNALGFRLGWRMGGDPSLRRPGGLRRWETGGGVAVEAGGDEEVGRGGERNVDEELREGFGERFRGTRIPSCRERDETISWYVFREFGKRRLRLTTSSRVATSGLRPKGLSGPPVLGDLRRGDPSLFFFIPPPKGRLAERGGGC